jgi:4'-phosphopantetheinyl transferase
MLPLGEQIHLWLVHLDQLEHSQIHHHRELLSDQERKQESRFYLEKHRHQYVVTRALVRNVLSRYEAVAPRDWIFSSNAFGRPEIANVAVRGSGLLFSVSHTHSLIVLGVAKRRALGVDVENVHARGISMDIAERFFSAREAADLAKVPPKEQRDRFFQYWTLKESYIKARGMGLSIPLDKFSFYFQHARDVKIAIQPELADCPERWMFWQFRPTSDDLVAVCAERTCEQPPSVTIRKAISMDLEDILEVPFCRISQ